MLVLALDTTTPHGSLALARDDQLLDAATGTEERTHGERLPGEIGTLLRRHGLTFADIDRLVVAAGPGSFTGLRVGIATIQGLALALDLSVVGISVLDALVEIARAQITPAHRAPTAILPWMDGKRGEVFSALYEPPPAGAAWVVSDGPVAAPPGPLLERWRSRLVGQTVWAIGDGLEAHGSELRAALSDGSRLIAELPPIAGVMARMAGRPPWQDAAQRPHALRPVYVRRPDAELARDRRRDTP